VEEAAVAAAPQAVATGARGKALAAVVAGTAARTAAAPRSNKCSDAVLDKLLIVKDKACDVPRSCSGQLDNCASATAKVAAGYACTDAREDVQRKCYSPGDPGYEGHMKQIAEAYAALRNCQKVQSEKC